MPRSPRRGPRIQRPDQLDRRSHVRSGVMLFIFEVRIRPGHRAEQYADAWVRASRIIQRAPGALGTRLHRKIGDAGALVAIARWESKQARDAAEATLRDDAGLRAILGEAAAHAEITIVGEFEEPEWVVLPDA